jgi:two-component system chemotaxis sensor kinase CheA
VSLILDVMGLAHVGKVLGEGRGSAHSTQDSRAEGGADRQKVLLFRCGDGHRLAVPLVLVDRLEEFASSRIESAGQRTVVQYRGRILPLIQLGDHVESIRDYPSTTGEKVQVIVFSQGAIRFGVLVEEIVDIVEEAVTVRARSGTAGLLGSVVIGGQVTDFIDVRYLIGRIESEAVSYSSDGDTQARVLVVDSSAFARGLLRGDLEMAGHRVMEASDARDALERLGRDSFDVVVASLDLPDAGAQELLKKLRDTPEFAHIPTIGLSDEGPGQSPALSACNESRNKRDREAVLESVARLARSVAREEWAEVAG